MPGVFSVFQRTRVFQSQFIKKVFLNEGITQRISPQIVRFQSVAVTEDDYQYMTKSLFRTTHFQDSLPHLPIPKLKDTCNRYLRAQRPLLDDQTYEKTKAYVEDFFKNEGVELNDLLLKEDRENSQTSYISKLWFDMYLYDRQPLPINVNPFLVFVRNQNELYNSQMIRASNLVISSLRFYKSLLEGRLDPEIFHLNPKRSKSVFFKTFTGLLPKRVRSYGAYMFQAFPLDMSQFPWLFGSTRIPKIDKDYIINKRDPKHLLIMRRGNFYVMDVIDENGYILPPDVILASIKNILTSDEPAAKHPVGVLTTENRDVWAAARKHLESLGNNFDYLRLIDNSLFNLVLDDESPGNDPVRLIRSFLHGDGLNRWFDKSFSLIVTKDGHAGVNFEHSWGDGVAVLRYFNDVHADSTLKPRVHSYTEPGTSARIRKLDFILDDKMKVLIDEAKKKYSATCKSLEVRALEYNKFGRQLCNPLNISPDAMVQLAFQFAYDKLKGKHVATYESCSTSAFKHGRTETVRPCTIETQEFCKAMRRSTTPSRIELQELIRNCSNVHSKLIKEAAMGRGFDRHLFALKLKADSKHMELDIFTDPAYAAMNHNILSTSTLTSDSLLLGAFGPVVPDGYGIGYSIWKEKLGAIVTNYEGDTDGEGFVQALQQSLDIIHTILRHRF